MTKKGVACLLNPINLPVHIYVIILHSLFQPHINLRLIRDTYFMYHTTFPERAPTHHLAFDGEKLLAFV